LVSAVDAPSRGESTCRTNIVATKHRVSASSLAEWIDASVAEGLAELTFSPDRRRRLGSSSAIE
jgi:hypothetical protein